LFLADLEPVRLTRALRGDPPLRATATYLVSVWAPDIAEVYSLTRELLFSAMEQTAFSAVNSGSTLWRALGFPPHPSFMVQLTLERTRQLAPLAPPVGLMRLDSGLSRVLRGAVRGPNKVPIADALVEIPSLNLQVRSDEHGIFELGAVMAGQGTMTIHLTVKGARREIKARLPRFPAPLLLDVADPNP
jgi:hypothetical protein